LNEPRDNSRLHVKLQQRIVNAVFTLNGTV